jgi:uncharacterized protein (DUF983 family)
MTKASQARALPVLLRGLRKRCPRCGRGRLFSGWFTSHDQCSECSLVYEVSPGSIWGFWVIGDRIFVVAALLPFYLTLPVPDPGQRALLSLLVLIPLVLTVPNRLGLARALDFLWRLHWGDPNESSPPHASPGPEAGTDQRPSEPGA